MAEEHSKSSLQLFNDVIDGSKDDLLGGDSDRSMRFVDIYCALAILYLQVTGLLDL